MTDHFPDRHKRYNEYISRKGNQTNRSALWDQYAPEFVTQVKNDKPILDTYRKQGYFIELRPDPGFSMMEKIRFRLWNLSKKFPAKLQEMLVPPAVKGRHVFRRLKYYKRMTAKYSLMEHPLIGRKHVLHSDPLYIQWINHCRLYPHLKSREVPKVLEIGAGSGLLAVLMKYDLDARVTIIDLPEMISYTTACVKSLLPDATIVFPNEIENDKETPDRAFTFLWPNQIDVLEDDFFDLAVNVASLGEMTHAEIVDYFKLIQRVTKKGGYFFCSNRFRRNPKNVSPDDAVDREFFMYPWDPLNKDVFVDINRYRYEVTDRSYPHIFIDRLQQIVK